MTYCPSLSKGTIASQISRSDPYRLWNTIENSLHEP
nr:MAG TPA: hypothetical protein [Caudoviricetes sp.]